jgi:hypothetical protein
MRLALGTTGENFVLLRGTHTWKNLSSKEKGFRYYRDLGGDGSFYRCPIQDALSLMSSPMLYGALPILLAEPKVPWDSYEVAQIIPRIFEFHMERLLRRLNILTVIPTLDGVTPREPTNMEWQRYYKTLAEGPPHIRELLDGLIARQLCRGMRGSSRAKCKYTPESVREAIRVMNPLGLTRCFGEQTLGMLEQYFISKHELIHSL